MLSFEIYLQEKNHLWSLAHKIHNFTKLQNTPQVKSRLTRKERGKKHSNNAVDLHSFSKAAWMLAGVQDESVMRVLEKWEWDGNDWICRVLSGKHDGNYSDVYCHSTVYVGTPNFIHKFRWDKRKTLYIIIKGKSRMIKYEAVWIALSIPQIFALEFMDQKKMEKKHQL